MPVLKTEVANDQIFLMLILNFGQAWIDFKNTSHPYIECIILNQIELVFKLLKLTFKKVKSLLHTDSQVLIAFGYECENLGARYFRF